jgi:hypothetical protein
MGQQEVYDFLMKNPDSWYTSKEISEQLVVSIGSVTMSLKKLRKTNIIKYRNTGKRNTFQYMVQSEPAKLQERKSLVLEQMPTQPSEQKVRVKIKPKVVHQHTYLSGQTFYGVIRPKEEVDAMERQREQQQTSMAAKLASRANARTATPTKTRVSRIAASGAAENTPTRTVRKRSASAAKKTSSRAKKSSTAKKTTKRAAKKSARRVAKKAVRKKAVKKVTRSRAKTRMKAKRVGKKKAVRRSAKKTRAKPKAKRAARKKR